MEDTRKTTIVHLSYLAKVEAARMTEAMPFLTEGGENGKGELIKAAENLYGIHRNVRLGLNNGNYPYEYGAWLKADHFLTLIEFREKDLTPEAIELLGSTTSNLFSYYYAIMWSVDNKRLYVASFADQYAPNWNLDYLVKRWKPLEEVAIPLLREGTAISKMDDSLHEEINRLYYEHRPVFDMRKGHVQMTIHDQHGNYKNIEGVTLEQLFRDFADNYTGYNSYRRQQASEWTIYDPETRKRFEEWKLNAKGLKSDFEKFYGGAVVD